MTAIESERPVADQGALNMRYIWAICLVAAMGGLLFGYDWVVIGGAAPFYQKYFHLVTPALKGWTMSCALVGCLIGAVGCGVASDALGRKRLLVAAAFLFCVSSVGTGLAPTYAMFVLWRILGGVAIGLASNLSPIYIAEVAPENIRGRLVAANQLTIAIGVVAAQVVNWWIARPVPPLATAAQILHSWNGQYAWRWMFAATTVPSLLFFLGMFFAPESPRWLMKQGRAASAKAVLTRVGGPAYGEVTAASIAASLQQEGEGFDYHALLNRRMSRVLTLGVVLAVFQQWCGINIIFNYGAKLFSTAGYPVSGELFNIVLTGITALLCAVLAMFLVDRIGRRVMMLAGAAGLVCVYALLGLCFWERLHGPFVVALIILAVAVYACTLAPVTWVVLSEIFPNGIRGAATAVSVFALWAACFVLTDTFPFIYKGIGPAGAFWLYGGICIAGLAFIYAALPETKGRTLEQIEAQLVK